MRFADAGFRDAFFDRVTSEFCVVTDFAEGGDLFEMVKYHTKVKLPIRESVIWTYIYHIALGLKHLHSLNIVHRDIKAANIFLNKDKSVALVGDLNVSKVAKDNFLRTQTGTPYYASPEVFSNEPYDCKSDIWSLGCLSYELCSLVPPFRAKDMNQLYEKVTK